MAQFAVRDVDFTTARIHARHGRMAEGARLDQMCRIRTVPELARNLWDDASPSLSSRELQKRVAAEFAAEIDSLAMAVPEGVRLFFETLREGRRAASHASLEADTAAAREYYETLLARARKCAAPHARPAFELASQEASIFLGMLALRLVFNYEMKPDAVAAHYFDGTLVTRPVFDRVVGAAGLADALEACGEAIAPGAGPFQAIPELERAAWDRYFTVARRIWAADPTGVGAIIGYVGIRRIEVANLVTLSEGLRLGVESRRLRSYLVPHVEKEGRRV